MRFVDLITGACPNFMKIAPPITRTAVSSPESRPQEAFLSGDLDGGAVAAETRNHCAGRLQCFALDFDPALAPEEGETTWDESVISMQR